MSVVFTYDKEKDIWCLLNKGKSSNNSAKATRVYEELIARFGEEPTEADTALFIDGYLQEKGVDLEQYIQKYQEDWENVADEYHTKAEGVFGVVLPHDVTAYVTINNRNPYNIKGRYFFVTVPKESVRHTIMHELWHFYTWEKFGEGELEELGREKYNNMKESLTVLLNSECSELLAGVVDTGYPQHKELREKVLEWWNENQDIDRVWKMMKNYEN